MTLANNAVHLYIANATSIIDPDLSDPGQSVPDLAAPDLSGSSLSGADLLQRYEALLSDDERSRMHNFHYERHRQLYLITRALVRTSLSEYADVEPAEWRFEKNNYGKPFISHPSARPGLQPTLQFNISHTAGIIVCAITSGKEVGVDVEDRQRSTRAAFSSLFSYFSPAEIAELEALSPDLQKHRFFEHWTLKEAYIKARGAGFAIPLHQFGFHFDGDELSVFHTHPDLKDPPQKWQFWQYPYADRYAIAIALATNKVGMQLTVMESVPLQQTRAIQAENLSHFMPGSLSDLT